MTNSKITYQSIASIVLSQPETFSRQGFVTASYRTSRGRKYGPYYRLAYRDQQNRQRSIYLGRSEELADLVQSLLDKLKTPLRRRRECRGIRVALLANLRAHKKRWKADLAAYGLYIKCFSVRGWRTLHPAKKIKGDQRARNMDNSFSSSAAKQKNMPPKTTVKADINRHDRDCPDFCVSKNGTVPFAAYFESFLSVDTKILTGPKIRAQTGVRRMVFMFKII
jgi:hypothetical protein